MSSSSETRLETVVAAASRLDRALAGAFPDMSRARFQGLIAEGRVHVEGAVVTDAAHRVKAGQAIVVTVPGPTPAAPQAEVMPLHVLYEDGDVIVIDKPAGLVVHPGAGNERGTLVNALIAHCGDSLSGIGGVKRPGIVHRLDKDTSGVLVVAKNDKAHASLAAQFAAHGRDGRLDRAYLALVWGVPDRMRGTIRAGLARSSSNRKKIAVSASAAAREAITHYERLETFGNPPAACLVCCRLETGRTHQIRVHMAHIGHPILGDRTYGSHFRSAAGRLSETSRNALKSLKRQALHAYLLTFEHPRTGRRLSFEVPPPADFGTLLEALRRADMSGHPVKET